MSDTEELTLKLKALGLTQYEVKTLITLIALSSATAEEIHQQTDIPTPRIYDTIDSLEKKGLVRTISGRPMRFEAFNLKKGLDNLFRFTEEEYHDKLDKMAIVSREIITLMNDPEYQSRLIIKPDELLEAYSSLEEMQLKTKDIIKKANKEVSIFTNVFYWYDQVKQELKEAKDRGVNIKVLMSTEDDKSKKVAENLIKIGASVRSLSKGNVLARGTLVDQEQVVFVIWVSPVPNEKYVYRPHFSSNSGIIEIFSNNFEHLWEKGQNFTD
ncbi:TrmB family transcriptional regulator [Candidatus Heimdallarchaeota archaeon]|nr:MAG: TrmB family transcriptional regulator [Candidatus Heimdallarchaeota archaeon]